MRTETIQVKRDVFCLICDAQLTKQQVMIGNVTCSRVCGARIRGNVWSDKDSKVLIDAYKLAESKPISIKEIARKLNRTEGAIKGQAFSLGITGKRGRNSSLNKINFPKNCEQCGVEFQPPQRTVRFCSKECGDKGKWTSNKHPKGMKGKTHTGAQKKKMSKRFKAMWDDLSAEERSDKTLKMMKAKLEKLGTLAVPIKKQKVTWKQGWREIGGIKKYYRSRWEANYARYLEWLKSIGEIKAWEHEPDTFWFEGILRGVRSYLPDFKVTEKDGEIVYHEVKGWMDDRSKTKIKRMAKYHPSVKLIVIDSKAYNSLAKQMSNSIEGWEK